jgi:hypothetical protein
VPLYEVTATATYPDAGPRPDDDAFRAFGEGDERSAQRDDEAGEWRLIVTYVIRESAPAKAKNRALARFAEDAEAAGAASPAQVRLTVAE